MSWIGWGVALLAMLAAAPLLARGVQLCIRMVQDKPDADAELGLDDPDPVWPDAPAAERGIVSATSQEQ